MRGSGIDGLESAGTVTPFFLLRMWLKRAPLANQVSAGFAVAVALALLVWIAVPGGGTPAGQVGLSTTGNSDTSAQSPAGSTGAASSSANGPAAASNAATSPGSSAAGPSSPAAGATGAPVASGSGPAGSGAAPARSGPTGTRPANSSVSCTRSGAPIKLGVILPDVGTGAGSLNGFLGVPPVSQQHAFYQAVIDTINKAGGVQCHPLVGDYQAFNELDSSQSQTICLQFVQEHVFAALGGFEPMAPDTCLLQNHVPTFEQIMISTADSKRYYPYYFSTNGAFEVIIRNFVYAVAKLGYLGPAKGFKKLGVLMRNCIPAEQSTLMAALSANRVGSSQVDVYNFGCSSQALSDPANEISQAELQFWHDGVTDVTQIDASTDLQTFTNDANSQQAVQHWRPYYLVPDDGAFATISAPQNAPNGSQFDGAVGITGLQYGGIEAGLPESAATQKCDAIMVSHGLPTVYKSGDQFAGSPCDLLWMLAAAMANDPGLAPTGLAAGLNRVGSIAMAYPDGPNTFAQPGETWGGEFWREDVFNGACKCFKAAGASFSPSF
jgi:hypothetical protein